MDTWIVADSMLHERNDGLTGIFGCLAQSDPCRARIGQQEAVHLLGSENTFPATRRASQEQDGRLIPPGGDLPGKRLKDSGRGFNGLRRCLDHPWRLPLSISSNRLAK